MSTFTASLQFSPNLKAVHTGVLAMGSRTSICATGTASSVILLGNVPDGATLLDWWAHIITAGTAQTVKIGTSNTPSGIAAAFSLTLTISASTQNYLLAGALGPPRDAGLGDGCVLGLALYADEVEALEDGGAACRT